MLEAILSKPSSRRAPIEMGEGEPVLLLHPFMLSQSVWETVAEQLADAGYEVFAPTYPGHNGGGPMPPLPPLSQRSVDVYLDQVEQIMDQKGWETAHLVGNSLGGWIALGLALRGRARSVTAIAPAGGWTKYSPLKAEIVVKFAAMLPWLAFSRLLGRRAAGLPFVKFATARALCGETEALSLPDFHSIFEDITHCPAYFASLTSILPAPGLQNLNTISVPAQLVLCEKDEIVPPGRFGKLISQGLPADARRITLAGMGHVPMLEAPGQVTEVITDLIDPLVAAKRAAASDVG